MHSLSSLLSLVCLLAVSGLHVGDTAPALTGTSWIRGKAPVFQDQLTVVEFWATWCGACRSEIPHLTRLQRRYGDRVAVVGLSTESEEVIGAFVKEMGDQMQYNVGRVPTDLRENYMAGRKGIPHAFLLGRDGAVMWEGHPMDLDDVLADAVAGRFSRDVVKQVAALESALKKSLETNDLNRVADAADALLAIRPSHERALRIRGIVARRQKDPAGFRAVYEGIDVSGLSGDKAARLAWELVTQKELPYRNVDLALKFAEHALKFEPGSGEAAKTYARVLYCLGDIDRAVEWQRKALGYDGDEELGPDLEYYLKVKAMGLSGEKKEGAAP